MGNRIDITGNIYGRLTVLQYSHTNELGTAYWLCSCTCGGLVARSGSLLRRGSTKSCGCIKPGSRPLNSGVAKSEQTLFKFFVNKARGRGHTPNLTLEQWRSLINKPCVYSGHMTNGPTAIDRIDSTIGYTLENCVPCCGECNRAKGQMAHEEFITYLRETARFVLGVK